MKTKLLLLSLVLFAGCQSFQAEKVGPSLDAVYGETLDLLTDMRITGDISDQDWHNIQAIATETNEVLQQWYEAQEAGIPAKQYELKARNYIRQLRLYLKEEEDEHEN